MSLGAEQNPVTADRPETPANGDVIQYTTGTYLQEQSGIPKKYIFAGFGGAVVVVGFLGLGAVFCAHLVSLLYPAYRSFKAVSRLKTLTKQGADVPQEEVQAVLQKVTKYLMYWVVYGCFNILEYLCSIFLWIIPFYWPLKMLFLLWCVHPDTHGAVWVYDHVARPILEMHKPHIDSRLRTLRKATSSTVKEIQLDIGIFMRANGWKIWQKFSNFLPQFQKPLPTSSSQMEGKKVA